MLVILSLVGLVLAVVNGLLNKRTYVEPPLEPGIFGLGEWSITNGVLFALIGVTSTLPPAEMIFATALLLVTILIVAKVVRLLKGAPDYPGYPRRPLVTTAMMISMNVILIVVTFMIA